MLLDALFADLAPKHAAMCTNVHMRNPAKRLYERKGFRGDGGAPWTARAGVDQRAPMTATSCIPAPRRVVVGHDIHRHSLPPAHVVSPRCAAVKPLSALASPSPSGPAWSWGPMEHVKGHLPAVLDHNQFPHGLEAQTVREHQTALIPALHHRTQRNPE
ncbi:hypothetical protein [Mycolicibacterium tokaiense]|uniref:hypothetical protein n=1 Tax=Mycolicibacterium tokaiense TaxID=39695 RepID=UPI00338D4722